MAGSLTPPERAALQEAAGAMMKLARFEERPAAQARPEDG